MVSMQKLERILRPLEVDSPLNGRKVLVAFTEQKVLELELQEPPPETVMVYAFNDDGTWFGGPYPYVLCAQYEGYMKESDCEAMLMAAQDLLADAGVQSEYLTEPRLHLKLG